MLLARSNVDRARAAPRRRGFSSDDRPVTPRAADAKMSGMTRSILLATMLAAAAVARADDAPPAGMAWVPAGEFRMGSADARFPDAQPVHRVWVDGFWMDVTEVTNAQFARFVEATGYVTLAERTPRAEDFPGVPAEALVAGSVVFSPPPQAVPLGDVGQWWRYVRGANWRHPEGPSSDVSKRADHPVVHIAYADAEAYAKWAGKRLPTEAEWERAARGGQDQLPYAWGTEFKPGGRFAGNTFQGHFPEGNRAEDGFAATAPVGSFPANPFGLYDVAGNVWEWTSDWYRPDQYAIDARAHELTVNPRGPSEKDSFDPNEPGVRKRVQRGGSFLCTDQYCSRYMPGARGQGEPTTGASHVGFRCAMTPTTMPAAK